MNWLWFQKRRTRDNCVIGIVDWRLNAKRIDENYHWYDFCWLWYNCCGDWRDTTCKPHSPYTQLIFVLFALLARERLRNDVVFIQSHILRIVWVHFISSGNFTEHFIFSTTIAEVNLPNGAEPYAMSLVVSLSSGWNMMYEMDVGFLEDGEQRAASNWASWYEK